MQINLEQSFLSCDDVSSLWGEIRRESVRSRLVVGIDAPPGVGKTTLGDALLAMAALDGVPAGLIHTDLGVLPRADRPKNTNVMDWTDVRFVQEAIRYPGAEFDFLGYDVFTKMRTQLANIFSPERGVLIIEGLHGITGSMEVCDHVFPIQLQVPEEVREIRRLIRNVTNGRWSREEALNRTAAQRGSIHDYYDVDLTRLLR